MDDAAIAVMPGPTGGQMGAGAPGSCEILALLQRDLPWIDPLDAAAAFADCADMVLLDSRGPVRGQSRHAFLCVDPVQLLAARGDPAGAMLAEAGRLLGRFRLPPPGVADMPFRGGLAGLIGYEYGAGLEAVPMLAPGADDPPDLVLGLYDLVIGFDRQTRIVRLHATGLPARSAAGRAARAQARLDWAEARISGLAADRPAGDDTASGPSSGPPELPPLDLVPDWTEASYLARCRRVLDYIAAGDIFQANLTMRFTAPRPPGLAAGAVQAALRARNPAPFSAWLRHQGFDLCCSSPEHFLGLDAARALSTSPIKGTIARAADPATDAANAARLLASEKDRAENVMIVDVLRNDLGRVAAIGSVAVPALCALRSYATVHHLVSSVTARLRPGLAAIDALRAALPGGSITGAPKIRAMQIIAEIEAARRGPYCGTVLALGLDGAMTSNIVIRSLSLTPQRVIAQAGGGIVADSDPEAEYAEMLLKAAPMRGLFRR